MNRQDAEAALRWRQAQDLFHQALTIPASERRSHLYAVCSDETLVCEVLDLLEEDSRSDSILEIALPDLTHSLVSTLPDALAKDNFRQYRILELLGQGGAGTVYRAERIDLGTMVAVKILSSGTLSSARRLRFIEEEKTLAQLDHPSIARILDADTLGDGTPWFAMECVEGSPITLFCASRDCGVDERLRLFRAVCEAVRYAHGRAIIHLDLKPSNILVKEDGTPKLLDFGIARHLAEVGAKTPSTLTAGWPLTPRLRLSRASSGRNAWGAIRYLLARRRALRTAHGESPLGYDR